MLISECTKNVTQEYAIFYQLPIAVHVSSLQLYNALQFLSKEALKCLVVLIWCDYASRNSRSSVVTDTGNDHIFNASISRRHIRI